MVGDSGWRTAVASTPIDGEALTVSPIILDDTLEALSIQAKAALGLD